MPEDYPWGTSREDVEGLFLTAFDTEGCLVCHAAEKQGAEVVFASIPPAGPLTTDKEAEYMLTVTNLWTAIKTSEPATLDTPNPVGRLWIHHPNFPAAERESPIYTENDTTFITRISRLYLRAEACESQRYLAMPADAGSMCGDPTPRDAGPRPDAGPDSDGGGVDGGGVDGGVVDSGGGGGDVTGLCYCDELPDAGITPDLIQYCR